VTGSYWWLAGICGSQILFHFVQQHYSAALPLLVWDWGMSASQAGLVSSAFQIGYLVSTVTFSALADRFGAGRLYLVAAGGGAVTSFLFGGLAGGFASAFILFGLMALFLGGTYTPAIQLMAAEFPPERRGRAMGLYIASSTLGNALSLALAGRLIVWASWRAAFVLLAFGPALGFVVGWVTLRGRPKGPPAPRTTRGFSTALLRNRPALGLMAAYTTHSWELMAMRGWVPAFLTVAVGAGGGERAAAGLGASLSSLFMLVGILSTSTAGYLSDRWGRASVILAMTGLSGACSLAFGWMMGAPLALIVAVGLLYGFSAIGDSPVLSAGITEVVPAQHLGSALAIRAGLGFGAGALAPWAFGAVLDLSNPGARGAGVARYTTWGWAFTTAGIVGLSGLLGLLWVRESRQEGQDRDG
jgi:MFS family permease